MCKVIFNSSLMVKVVSLHAFSNIFYIMENMSAEIPNVEWGAKQTEGREGCSSKTTPVLSWNRPFSGTGEAEISRFLIIPLSLLGRGTLE